MTTESTAVEAEHLEATLGKVREAINDATNLVSNTEKSYQSFKQYMVDNRGEIDPSEQFQNERYLSEVDRQSALALVSKERLEKLLESPYFARVDFEEEGKESATVTYIGRFSFNHNNTSVISDWRSPVAGLFYGFDLGAASYEAPIGTVSGTLKKKRQLEIEQGKLIYAFDTDSSVRDEVLQRELAKTSDQKMKSIISSIQREQNEIIRDESTGSLIIQGVAGSGKTSIALHRVAYLLYSQKDHLNSRSVAILSPNRVFGDYISKVLPELGEEPVHELYLDDIFAEILQSTVDVQQVQSFVDGDSAWRKRASYKSTFAFAQLIHDYLKEAESTIFEAQPLSFGRHSIDAEWLEEQFYSYKGLPFNERIELLVSSIHIDLSSPLVYFGTRKPPTKGEIRTQLIRMLRAKDALALYKQFYKDRGIAEYFSQPSKKTIEWEDACPLVFFRGAFDRLEEYRDIKHLVVDEMQDLTPLQHQMMAQLFTCEKTILGDCNQIVHLGDVMTLEHMRDIYDATHVFTLMRSYRSTHEIMELAGRVKEIPNLETVARHGREPELIACGDSRGVLEKLDELITRFEQGEHKTLGILHKSDEMARRYYGLLAGSHALNLITGESDTFENGVSISSIRMAKGLEFDEVIVIDVEDTQYASDYGRNLLYIAITRAMHELTLLYRSKPSKFLQ